MKLEKTNSTPDFGFPHNWQNRLFSLGYIPVFQRKENPIEIWTTSNKQLWGIGHKERGEVVCDISSKAFFDFANEVSDWHVACRVALLNSSH